MKSTLEQFKAARRAGVPLIVWNTPDPTASMEAIRASLDASQKEPVARWDVMRGMKAITGEADSFCANGADTIGNAVAALELSYQAPEDSIIFVCNFHRFIADPQVMQGVFNLRDKFKGDGSTLVLLCPFITTPAELTYDIFTINELLPDREQLGEIVKREFKNNGLKIPAGKELLKVIDAVNGLSAFAAEQVIATSFQGKKPNLTLNYDDLWERKRQSIEQTQGLKVWRGGESFKDIGGYDNFKRFATAYINGTTPPEAVVFVEEIEKALAGSGGGHDGTKADQLGVLLTEMEDNNAQGLLLIGHPGSAKSMFGKSFGNEAQIPTIKFDLGGMRGEGLVGQAENAIRAAMKIVQSISNKNALYIATCNKIDVIPPELQRRFTLGTFFFDLPTTEERDAIWNVWLPKFNLKTKPAGLKDEGWTGADIRNCCNLANALSCSLEDASLYMAPICKTRPQQIEALKTVANEAFVSATYPGLYRKGFVSEETKQRKMKN